MSDKDDEFQRAIRKARTVDRPSRWRPWSEVKQIDVYEGDENPELPGTSNLKAAARADRCCYPLRRVYEKHGKIRYCTQISDRRYGRGRWSHGSIYCRHHKDVAPTPGKSLDEVGGEWVFTIMTGGTPEELRERLDQPVTA